MFTKISLQHNTLSTKENWQPLYH